MYNGCLKPEELNLPEAGSTVAKWRWGRSSAVSVAGAASLGMPSNMPSSGPSEFTALTMTHVLCKKEEPVGMERNLCGVSMIKHAQETLLSN